MPVTSDQIWDALYRLGTEDGIPIATPVIAKMIDFKMVQLGATGLPELTSYGEKCFVILESGDGHVAEPADLASIEDQQAQQQQ